MNAFALRPLGILGTVVLLASTSACLDDSEDGGDADAGESGAGGTAGGGATGGTSSGTRGAMGGTSGGGTGGGGTGGTGAVPPVSRPVPPGPGDVEPPTGTGANLRVLPWAGFAAAVTYTFDDSQPSQLEHFDELDAMGVPMTFYINTSGSYQAGYDATFQRALESGHEIGNHTVNHCRVSLTECSTNLGSIDAEIDECSAYIETNIGQAGTWTFAFPYGDAGYVPYAETRFFLARGVSSGTVLPGGTQNPLNLPTISAVGNEAAEVFSGHIDSARAQGRWLNFLFHSILPTSQNWYAGVDIASITGSIEHAKELEDVWIDSMVNVGGYWVGQRTLEAVTPTTEGDTTTWTWSLPAHFPPGQTLRVVVDGGTLSQEGEPLTWDGHGYYEIALDPGSLTHEP